MSAPGLTPTTFAHATDDGERLWLLGGLYTYKATGDETGDAYSLFQVKGPGGLATPMHRHEHEEEGFYVVDGAVTVFADGDEHELRAGGFAFVPRGTPTASGSTRRGDPAPAHQSRRRRPRGDVPRDGRACPRGRDPGSVIRVRRSRATGRIAGRHGTIITGPPPEPR